MRVNSNKKTNPRAPNKSQVETARPMPVAAGLVHLAGLERFDLECFDGLEVSGIGGNDSEFVLDGGGGDEPHQSVARREPARVGRTTHTQASESST